MALLRPSLVVTTYNKPEYLNLVLLSTLNQSVLPFEVIVADDGSREETKELVDEFRRRAPFPVVHVWQEDNGFQAAAIRNKAFAVCRSEYIITIDGDIILHSHFVRDHASHAKRGYFISGGRIMLREPLTKILLKEKRSWINSQDLTLKKYLKVIRIPWLSPLLYGYRAKDYKYGVSANMSFWKEDLKRINGFDEEFVGWGYEDFDVMLRFMNAGIKKRYLRFCALSCHLYHPYSRGTEESLNANRLHFEQNEANHVTACKVGMNQYTGNAESYIIGQ